MIRNRILLLAIGSNFQSWNRIRKAKRLIQASFPSIVSFSSIVMTEPIGIGGKPFSNCMAIMLTDLSIEETTARLKKIECACGNTDEKRARNIIEMDIDILMHGGKRYHEQDWDRPYIRQLLQEISIPLS